MEINSIASLCGYVSSCLASCRRWAASSACFQYTLAMKWLPFETLFLGPGGVDWRRDSKSNGPYSIISARCRSAASAVRLEGNGEGHAEILFSWSRIRNIWGWTGQLIGRVTLFGLNIAGVLHEKHSMTDENSVP